jgi:N-methylhydantoinase A/oxoprolinase/acetone carboxylase beta subunit
VETILSGPAASVVGAGFLTGASARDALVVDIGGTTSDIALLQGGVPKLNETGVTVGPWQTHVTAVDVRTLGLGGDSHIRLDSRGEILVGPRRVEPLCLLGNRFPAFPDQMKIALSQPNRDARFVPTAFWYAAAGTEACCSDAREEEILSILSEGPLNIFQMAERLGTYPLSIRAPLRRLEDRHRVVRAGFTPTDIFHVRGLYASGRRDCSETAAGFLARQAGVDVERLLTKTDEILNRRLGLEVIESLSGRPLGYPGRAEECPACDRTWENCFWEGEEAERRARLGLFKMRLSLEATIVGIGAPAHILVPPFARRLETGVHIPEHAEVANALGAIVGSILISEQILIRPLPLEGFACFGPAGRSVAPTIDRAVEQGRTFLTEYLLRRAERAGGNGVELDLWEERRKAALSSGEEHLIEVILHGRAVSKPRLEARPAVHGASISKPDSS